MQANRIPDDELKYYDTLHANPVVKLQKIENKASKEADLMARQKADMIARTTGHVFVMIIRFILLISFIGVFSFGACMLVYPEVRIFGLLMVSGAWLLFLFRYLLGKV